jgi:hypothetical protein
MSRDWREGEDTSHELFRSKKVEGCTHRHLWHGLIAIAFHTEPNVRARPQLVMRDLKNVFGNEG